MSESLFECTSFKLGCKAEYDKSWSLIYFRCRHVFILWKQYERWSFLYFWGYSKATNKYLKSHDPTQESKYIYLDKNNLYGYVMSKFLPLSGLKWIDPKDFDSMKYSSKSSKGCVIEVDLEYPKELRQLENDSPLAPDKIGIKEKRLSSY